MTVDLEAVIGVESGPGLGLISPDIRSSIWKVAVKLS